MIVERRKTWISIAWLFGRHKFVATFSMFSRCNRNNKENCNEFMTYFRCAQNMRFINYSFSVVFSLVSTAVFASFQFHQNTFFIPVVVFLVLPRNLFMNLSSEKVVAFEMRVCAKCFLFHFSFFSVLKMHFRFLSSPAATTSNIAHVKPTVEKLLDKNDKTAAAAKSIFFVVVFLFGFRTTVIYGFLTWRRMQQTPDILEHRSERQQLVQTHLLIASLCRSLFVNFILSLRKWQIMCARILMIFWWRKKAETKKKKNEWKFSRRKLSCRANKFLV